MKKLVIMLTTILIFTGCGASETTTQTTQTATETTTQSETQATPMPTTEVETEELVEDEVNTMVDRSGNTFEVPENIDRIICTAPSNNEILIALGLGDKLSVVDKYSADLEGISEDVLVIEFRSPDVEALILSESDILIASEHNTTSENEDPYAQLNDAGVPVVYIPTSVSIDAIYEDILFLGELTDTTDKAEEIVDDMKDRLEIIEEKISAVEKKTVYLEIAPAPNIYSLGKNTFLDEAIALAGGINIFAEEEGWISPSEEAILTENPQVIITNASYLEDADKLILERENWGVIDAVINEQVYVIDNNSSARSSQNVILAIEEIAEAIHPDLFN